MTNGLHEKICAFCGRAFGSFDHRAKYCRRACGNRGTAAARKAIYRARARARVEAIYGTLSDRELALVRDADSRGYQRGYQQARQENDREMEAA